MASWTLPSESPPTIRERRKVRKSVAHTHSRTLRMLPAMLKRRAVRRPYRSERVPITGEAIAWRRLCLLRSERVYSQGPDQGITHENKLPRAPPKSTISYLESIGLAKEALYAFNHVRICASTEGDLVEELNCAGASRLCQTSVSGPRSRFSELRPTLDSMLAETEKVVE